MNIQASGESWKQIRDYVEAQDVQGLTLFLTSLVAIGNGARDLPVGRGGSDPAC